MKIAIPDVSTEFYDWWSKQVVGEGVRRLADGVSEASHRTATYDDEETETMRELLGPPRPRQADKSIDERTRAPHYRALGKALELMTMWQLESFECLDVEVNRDDRWSSKHAGWEQLLGKTWPGTSRRLCVWVRPKPA